MYFIVLHNIKKKNIFIFNFFSARGSDFLQNFNATGSQHVTKIVDQITVLSQDIQKVSKDSFENFGNQLINDLPRIMSQELVKAMINSQSQAPEDDFEEKLPRLTLEEQIKENAVKYESNGEVKNEENYPTDYLSEYVDPEDTEMEYSEHNADYQDNEAFYDNEDNDA